MIRLSLLICLLGFSVCTNAQYNIHNITFDVKEDNLLFSKIDNYVKVSFPKMSKVSIISGHSNTEKINDTIFRISPNYIGKDTLELLENNKMVYKKIFEVREISQGQFILGTIRKKSASREEIVANRSLIFKNFECNCNIPFRIISFRIKFRSSNISDVEKEILIEGGSLSLLAVTTIRKLKKGDSIQFADIRAIIGAGCDRSYDSITLEIE